MRATHNTMSISFLALSYSIIFHLCVGTSPYRPLHSTCSYNLFRVAPEASGRSTYVVFP